MTHDERRQRRKAIADYIAEGHTAAEAAAKFGVSRALARDLANEHGLPSGPRRITMASVSAFAILKRLLDGGMLSEVAAEFGVMPQAIDHVRSYAEDAGFTFPKLKRGGKCKAKRC